MLFRSTLLHEERRSDVLFQSSVVLFRSTLLHEERRAYRDCSEWVERFDPRSCTRSDRFKPQGRPEAAGFDPRCCIEERP